MKKALCLITAILLLSSCQSGGETAVTDAVRATEVQTDAPAETTLLDALPTDLDYNGYEFHVLVIDKLVTNYGAIINGEEENGETLNDASVKVNRFVEERYNVDLIYDLQSSSTSFSINSAVSKSAMAGDDAYQYAQFGSAWDNCVSLITDGSLYNILDLPGIDLNTPGFYMDANAEFIINDQLYFAFSNYANTGCLPIYMVFNINMLKELDLELPYDTIFDGGWTMEVLEQYIKGVSSDLNGDGKIDGYDRHGLASGDLISNYLIFGADIRVAERNENGSYVPAIQNTAFVNAAQKFLDFKHNNPDVFIHEDTNGGTNMEHMFLLGNTLFAHTGSGLSNENMRAITDFDFGIAPLPKFDASQKDYGNYLFMNQFGIPSSIQNPEIVSQVIMGLAAASKVIMEPATLDVYVETKLLRDDESVQVLQMMQNDPLIDITRYFDFANGAITPVYLLSSAKDANNIMSNLEKKATAAEKKAEKFFSIFFEEG